MKYLIIFSYLLLQSFSTFSVFAECTIELGSNTTQQAGDFLAGCSAGTKGIDPGDSGSGKAGMRDLIIKIAQGAISMGALLAVGALVWSGIQYTTALGEDEKLKKAKTTGIYSLIGLILLLTSFGLVDIFINFIYTVTGNG